MTVSYSEALAAYKRVADQARAEPSAPQKNQVVDGGDFAQVLREAADEAVGTLKTGESQSIAAAAGKANINDVVTAMSEAEMTLQTVVTLRDKTVQAYQRIMRMPI